MTSTWLVPKTGAWRIAGDMAYYRRRLTRVPIRLLTATYENEKPQREKRGPEVAARTSPKTETVCLGLRGLSPPLSVQQTVKALA